MNKNLFQTRGQSAILKPATAVNAAGGQAYNFSDEHSLAQYVVTSCFGETFYATEGEQLEAVLAHANQCGTEFLAKAAVFGHEVAKMKDTPALLLCILASRIKNEATPEGREAAIDLFRKAFPRVVSRGKILFNFCQMIRSGKTGRRSFGTVAKCEIRKWLGSRTGNQLFTGSIGANPSLADVIKMTHPKPESPEKAAFYGYQIGKDYKFDDLPSKVREYEVFKRGPISDESRNSVPEVPFQLLAGLPLTKEHWKQIIRNMPWNALRMNLNTAARHGVFDDPAMVSYVAGKLADKEDVQRNNVFPYQLLTTYQNTTNVPIEVRNALQFAVEHATANVPAFGVLTAVCVDVSDSMKSAVTGNRPGATTATRCVDVAALVAATVARRNPNAIIVPFDTRTHDTKAINPMDSIMTNAEKLARYGGGGTNCASALSLLNGIVGQHNKPKLIVYVSDNQSWFNAKTYYNVAATPMANEWATYKRRVPDAKLVLIDIQAYANTQVQDSPGVFNIGGWSDAAFGLIGKFVEGSQDSFTGEINAVEL